MPAMMPDLAKSSTLASNSRCRSSKNGQSRWSRDGPASVVAAAMSVPLELGLALGGEGLEGAAEILRRHADSLGLGLGFDHLVDAHRPFLVQHGLGHGVGE